MFQLLQAGMPPSNLSYLIAAFLVTGLVFLGYVYFIFRRRHETQTEINRLLSIPEESESAGRENP